MDGKSCRDCAYWFRALSPPLRPGLGRCDTLEGSGEVFADAWDKSGIFTAPNFGCSLFHSASPVLPAEGDEP